MIPHRRQLTLLTVWTTFLLAFPSLAFSEPHLDPRLLGEAYLQYCRAAMMDVKDVLERSSVEIAGTGVSAVAYAGHDLTCASSSDPLYKKLIDPAEVAKIEDAVRSVGAIKYIQLGGNVIVQARSELAVDEIIVRMSQGEISADDLKRFIAFHKIKAKIDTLLSAVSRL